MRICLYLAIAFFICACSTKTPYNTDIKDLKQIKQNAYILLDSANLESSNANKEKLAKDYLKKHFSVWSEKPNKKKNEVFWIKNSLLNPATYGEHMQKNTKQYTQGILDSMQIDTYPNTNKIAIITRTTDVRAVPTQHPAFNKINGGYPFDRWQNSLIFANTPVLVTHTDTSGRWLHIQSAFVLGWVDSSSVAFVSNDIAREFKSHKQYITPIKDKIAIKNSSGKFVLEGRIGQIFALQKVSGNNVYFYVLARDKDGSAKTMIYHTHKSNVENFPLSLESKNLALSVDSMIGQRYGWGGYGENRDCSAFVRDIFTQYGIFLPRNSKAQINYGGSSIDLSKFNRKKKEAFILENAIPFKTLLWQEGHIMLYVGKLEDKALIAHSAWSVTTGKDIENMLGGVVITSLYVGEEKNTLFHSQPLLIDKISKMSNVDNLVQKITK